MSVSPDTAAPAPPDSPPGDGAAAVAPPPEDHEVRRAAKRTALLATTGFGVMQVLRFGANLLLTWMLLPEVFGMMALVDVFVIGLHMFSDVGIGSSIVRSKRDDREFLNTAWSVQVARGLVLWAAACLLAWPVTAFYNANPADAEHPTRLPLLLIPAVALTALINGFNSTAMFTLERRLMQGRLVLLQIGTYVAGMTVVVLWVYFVEADVWAMVIGRVFASVLEMAGSHILMPDPFNRFHWDRAVVHDLVHFGKWIFIGTACTFVADQADRLSIPKLYGTWTLGIYQVASNLSNVARLLMAALVPKLVFPLYSRAFHSGKPLRPLFSRLHGGAALFEAFLVTGLVACGPAAVLCLFRKPYWGAGHMLQIVAFGTWLAMLESTGGSVLWATGHSRTSAFSNMAKAATVPFAVLAAVLAAVLFDADATTGLYVLLVGFVVADLARYAVTATAMHRLGYPMLRYDLPLTVLIVVFVGLTWGAGRLVVGHNETEKWQHWLRLGLSVAVVCLLWSAVGLAAWRRGWLRAGAREGEPGASATGGGASGR